MLKAQKREKRTVEDVNIVTVNKNKCTDAHSSRISCSSRGTHKNQTNLNQEQEGGVVWDVIIQVGLNILETADLLEFFLQFTQNGAIKNNFFYMLVWC